MSFHRNAKLGLAGRCGLVRAVEGGMSLRAAAAAFRVSPATAHRWWHRWLEAGEEARRTLSCLFDRSSRPHRSPRQLAPQPEESICACRRETGWGPRLVAGATGFAHSTVWKVLGRAGISRPARAEKEPANRYEWPCPGRPAAHGCLHLRAVPTSRAPRHRRQIPTRPQLDAARDPGRLRLRARDHR
ncbi:MAG: helix-turn-helix domain-containing protein [Actinobacteria bacterium]|nr:helix-turn-helix domain-containing protein [Actinomycetota bacterium]